MTRQAVAPLLMIMRKFGQSVFCGHNMDQGIFYTPRLFTPTLSATPNAPKNRWPQPIRSGVRPYNAVEGDSYVHERWYT